MKLHHTIAARLRPLLALFRRPLPCKAHGLRPVRQDAGLYALGCPEGCLCAEGATRAEAVAEWNRKVSR